MFFVWEFNRKTEDFGVIHHSRDREEAIGFARAAHMAPDCLMALVIDGCVSENREECARYLGCSPEAVEVGLNASLVERFDSQRPSA